jgi:hypothetical protein
VQKADRSLDDAPGYWLVAFSLKPISLRLPFGSVLLMLSPFAAQPLHRRLCHVKNYANGAPTPFPRGFVGVYGQPPRARNALPAGRLTRNRAPICGRDQRRGAVATATI